ncbi:MAG: hypothetical protein ACRDL2_03940 [Gaiellaceae bacterium]
MKKALTAVVAAAAVAAPVASAAAATRHPVRKKVGTRVITVKKRVTGSPGSADRWGIVQVTLIVKKTTTIVGQKKKVKRTPVAIRVPVYPNHTSRSIFINQQAIPFLRQETLQAHFDLSKINVISGATYTSYAFGQSLHSALLKAKNV